MYCNCTNIFVDLNFAVFVDINWQFSKLYPLLYFCANNYSHNLVIRKNKLVKMLNLLYLQNTEALKICTSEVVYY